MPVSSLNNLIILYPLKQVPVNLLVVLRQNQGFEQEAQGPVLDLERDPDLVPRYQE